MIGLEFFVVAYVLVLLEDHLTFSGIIGRFVMLLSSFQIGAFIISENDLYWDKVLILVVLTVWFMLDYYLVQKVFRNN